MIILLYMLFLIVLALIGTYHWFYTREIKRTQEWIGFAPARIIQRMIAVNNVLVFSLTTFVVFMIVLNFFFGI